MYLDNSATTQVSEEVFKEMEPYFTKEFGNPSTLYAIGRESKKALNQARQRVANAINAKPEEIIFTSGGSESDNLAIKGIAFKLQKKGKHIITTEIEHPAVTNTLNFLESLDFKVTYLPVYENGIIKIEDLKEAITPETILITVMHGNNEIGTLQPIEEIGKIARENKIKFHTDAVQTFGKVEVDVVANYSKCFHIFLLESNFPQKQNHIHKKFLLLLIFLFALRLKIFRSYHQGCILLALIFLSHLFRELILY